MAEPSGALLVAHEPDPSPAETRRVQSLLALDAFTCSSSCIRDAHRGAGTTRAQFRLNRCGLCRAAIVIGLVSLSPLDD